MPILEIPEGYADRTPTEEEEARFTKLLREHAVCCGGNWSAMLMSAIRSGLPELYAAMPDRSYGFPELVSLIYLNLPA